MTRGLRIATIGTFFLALLLLSTLVNATQNTTKIIPSATAVPVLPNLISLNNSAHAFLNGTVTESVSTTYWAYPVKYVYQLKNDTYRAISIITLISTVNYPIALNTSYFKSVNANPSNISIYELENVTQMVQTVQFGASTPSITSNGTVMVSNVFFVATAQRLPTWVRLTGNQQVYIIPGTNLFKVQGDINNTHSSYDWHYYLSTANASPISSTVGASVGGLNLTSLSASYNTSKITKYAPATIDIDPAWSTPAGVLVYENLTYDNKQSYTLAANTAVPFWVNSLALNYLVANNLINVLVFNGFTQAIVPSWIQNQTSNAVQGNANTLIWIQYPIAIPATTNSVNAISIGFESLTTSVLSQTTTGIAPQFFCATGGTVCPQTVYGQYDNGNYVFASPGTNTFYTNFTHLSGSGTAVPSWLIANSLGGGTGSWTVNNGLTMTYTAGTTVGASLTYPFYTVNTLNTAYEKSLPTTSAGSTGYAWEIGEFNVLNTAALTITSASGGSGFSSCPNGAITGFNGLQLSQGGGGLSYCLDSLLTVLAVTNANGGSGPSCSGCITATSLLSSNLSTKGMNMQHNFTVINSITTGTAGYPTIAVSDSGTSTQNTASVQYWWETMAPPQGVFPVATNGPILNAPAYTAPTVTLSVSNTIIDTGQYETLTATISNGASPFTINFLVYNSVTNVQIANELLTGDVATSNTYTFQVPSYWTTNTLFYSNVFVTDSHPTTVNSVLSGKVPVSAPLTGVTLSLSNTLLDATQFVTGTATVTGGSSPYLANFLIVNSITGAVVNSILVTSATPSATFYLPIWITPNTISMNVLITDSATTNEITNSVYSTMGFNTVLTNPATISISNTLIDAGQFSTITLTSAGGTTPYVANFVVSNQITKKVVNSITVTSATPSATFFFPSILAGNTLQVNVIVYDSATSNMLANSVYSPLGFNSLMSTPTLVGTNSPKIDTNQYISFNAYESGTGTLPYTYNFIVYNSVTNVQVANMLTSGNFFLYQVTGNSYNTIYANVFITDAATTPTSVNSVLTSAWTVNAPVAPVTITASNTPTVNPLNYETFTATYGGSGPWTVNFLVYNSVTNAQMGNDLLVNFGSNTATYTFQVPNAWLGNTIYSNVFVTDSAQTAVKANSVLTGVITVTSSSVPTLTIPSNYMVWNSLFTLQGTSSPSSHTTNIYVTVLGSAQGSPLVSGTGALSYTLCSGANLCPQLGYWVVNVVDTVSSVSVTGNFLVYAPIVLKNVTGSVNTLTYRTYPACTNNFAGGNCIGGVVYTGSTSLTSNVIVAGNIVINTGVTLTTNGYWLVASGNFINLGLVSSGNKANAGTGNGGGNGAYGLYIQASNVIVGSVTANGLPGSVGSASGGAGGGGGGGGGIVVIAYYSGNPTPSTASVNAMAGPGGATGGSGGPFASASGANGGSTKVAGGARGTPGVAGTSALIPTLTNANILTWMTTNWIGYTTGAGGGGGSSGGSNGGVGSGYAISFSGAGGGGGDYTNGATAYAGGSGGNGNVFLYAYNNPPYPVTFQNTSYPYKLNAGLSTGMINYTLVQTTNNIVTNDIISGFNLSFQPPSSQAAGMYSYSILEQMAQGPTGQITLLMNVSANMISINNVVSCTYPIVQYLPNLCPTPSFAVTPVQNWDILSDNPSNQHSNTLTTDQWSNANQTFAPVWQLQYNGFNLFNVYLPNNPQTNQTFTQNAMVFVNSNTVPTNGVSRKLFNESGYDLQFFSTINTLRSDSFQMLLNNYTIFGNINFPTNILAFSPSGQATYMTISNYQNPKVVIQNYTTAATSAGYTGTTQNNYCPVTLSNGQFVNSFSYLPNQNASQYSMSVYLSNGQPATNYTLIVQAFGPPVTTVLSFKMVSASNFGIYLEPNVDYRFIVYNKNCASVVYTSAFNKWSNPISLTIPTGPTTPPPFLPVNLSAITHSCTNTPQVGNIMKTQCTFTNTAVPANAINMQLLVDLGPYNIQTCQNQTLSVTNTLTCYTPNDTTRSYSYFLEVNLNNGVGWLDIQQGVFGFASSGFGTDGALAAMIGCIILALIFVKYNLGISVALVGLGVEVFALITLISPLLTAGGGLIILIGVGLGIMMRGQ